MKLRIFITIVLCAFIPFIAHAATPGMTQYNSGWEQVNIKKYKLANASFTKALKSLPNNQKWMAIDGLGWVAYFLGKDAEAEKIFSSNIKRNPNASYSYKGLAFIQLRQKMWDKAALNLEHSFKLVPKQPISDYLFAANVFISAKKYSYATIVLGQALSIYPKSADINFYLAKSLYLASDKDKAYAFLATATYYDPIRISPLFNTLKGIDLNKTKDSLLNMGWGLYVAGYYKDALFRFNQCLGVDKNNSNALRGKGFSLLSLKQYKEANKALEISMSLPGHNKLKPVTTTFVAKNKKSIAIITDTETMLAWSEYYLGDYLNSQASFEQITTNHPDWVNAQLGLAYTLKALGKDFKPTVTQVNKLAPGYTSYIPEHSSHVLEVSYKLYNSGWKNIYAKQYSKAHKDFKDAMAKFPDNLKWLASDGMAWINYYEGKNSIAKSDFDKIIKSTPRATLSYKGLSYVYLKEKQYDKAYSTVQKLFSIKSLHNADVYSYLINSFTNAEKYTYAENLLNTALYYHPKSGELLLQKAKVLWLQGKKNEAYPVLKSAIYYAPIKVNNSLNAFKGIDTGKLQDSLLHIAWGLYVNGDNKAAFKQFESFYKSSPHKEPIGLDELNAIRGQGFCLLKLEQFQQAKNKLESVLNNKDASQLKPVTTTFYSSTGISIPIYVDATTSLGWANYSLGDYKNAERNFRAVLAEYPHWVNARLGLAYTLKAAGNDSYKKEVTIVNKYAPGYGVFIPNLPANISKKAFASYNSGWVNIFAQKYDDAIEDFTNAKGEFQSADKWLADDGIAWVSYNKTNYAEALVQFSNIVRHNSKAS
ncbi:MAG: hypothetical protein HOI53_05085, partial [Francisellaceae bacterium]|nr:hypothetical protein [Francisellaceae bacterium]